MRQRNREGLFTPTILTEKDEEKIVVRYKEGMSLHKLARFFHISEDRVRGMLKDANVSLRKVPSNPPRKWTREEVLSTLRERCRRNRYPPKYDDDLGLASAACRIFGTWNKALSAAGLPLNRIHEYPIKGDARILTPDKAYVLGALCGDGCQKSGRYQIKFSVSWGDKEFAEEFSRCFYRVYGILKHPTKEERWELGRIVSYATVIIDSKLAYLDLRSYCNFGTFTWRVPEQVKGAGEDVKRAFLQAYFDSDGSVDVKRHMITADSANHAGLKEIEALLRDFGVEVAGIYPYKKGDKEYFHLAVCNWRNLTNFLRIGFRLKRKQEKLLETLRKYRNRWLRHTNELYPSKKRGKYVFNDVQKAAKELDIITSGSLAQTLGICAVMRLLIFTDCKSRGC